jgi:hypothetical protein
MSQADDMRQKARALRAQANDLRQEIIAALPNAKRFHELTAQRSELMRQSRETVMNFRQARRK